MANPKQDKLSSLTDEVKELHPLLNALLPKLPNINNVEYTHGPDEMGADFVLSQRNPTFEFDEYVGVIAKLGKMAQDFSDIERQIEECAVERTFRGGKQKIRVDEIWIILTGNITKGAQIKIYEKYKSRKITFIQGEQLIRLIDKYLPNYWSDTTLLIGEYLYSLRLRNEENDRSFNLIQIPDQKFYIKQYFYDFPRM
jgi:hypothetical protein